MNLRPIARCFILLVMFLLIGTSAKSDTSCCTQTEIQDCYASATPENGCEVSYVGCSRFNSACFCAVLCPH